jgi:hypothetical protein
MLLMGFALVAGTAYADVNPQGVIFNERVFNDCPSSTLTSGSNYPAMIFIQDCDLSCPGFANLHVWRLSENGLDPILFENMESFRLRTTLTLTGEADGEAGLQVTPWWASDTEGRFNVRSSDGEIAAFGGRLPFYSFTASQGITYTRGDPITLEVTYMANDLNEMNPGTIEYRVFLNNTWYTSGALAFDEGNPGEGYGSWGILNDAQVGGHLQAFLEEGQEDLCIRAEWSNIIFESLAGTPVENTTWGKIKKSFQ